MFFAFFCSFIHSLLFFYNTNRFQQGTVLGDLFIRAGSITRADGATLIRGGATHIRGIVSSRGIHNHD